MPRYFFNVRNGESSLDPDGIELQSHAEAEREAIAAAGEMLRDAAGHSESLADWRMEVTDEIGAVIFTVSVSAQAH